MKYTYSTISDVSKDIKAGKVSSVDLVTNCLHQIEDLNPVLNAFITVLAEEALEQAAAADLEIKNGKWKGPLHGIPVAVKDFYDTRGIRTTAAFAQFKDRIPSNDAVVVQKLKKAGAILLGKTNMHELGKGTTSVVSFFGAVHNPWNPEYVAGGSSGGSAAAVAAGLCFATVDTDAVGSCRLPAACCGVTGFKGTYNLISAKGILDGEKTEDDIIMLSHVGIITRAAEDTALLLNVLADPNVSKGDYSKAMGSPKKYRLGIAMNYQANEKIKNSFLKAVAAFRKMHYPLTEIKIPFEAASFENMKVIDQERRDISALLFKDIDAVLIPTLTDFIPTIQAAEKAGPLAVSASNTFFCNYYALPAISIPCGIDTSGLPIGFQVVGPTWGEASVLAVANTYETTVLGFKPPPMHSSVHQQTH